MNKENVIDSIERAALLINRSFLSHHEENNSHDEDVFVILGFLKSALDELEQS